MAVKFSQFTSIVPTAGTYLVGYDGATNVKVPYSSLVGGSGTTNYLPKWTGSTALGDSLVFDDGTSVGIGTTSPGRLLQVNGTVQLGTPVVGASAASSTVIIDRQSNTNNLVLSSGNGDNSIRFRNYVETVLGQINFSSTGLGLGTNGNSQDLIIFRTTNRVGIGTTVDAGYRLDVTGTFRSTLDANINGLTIGRGLASLANNTALGATTLTTITTGDYNTAVGRESLAIVTTGVGNIGLGWASGRYQQAGNYNLYLGYGAGFYDRGSNNIFLGFQTGLHTTYSTSSNNLGIGHQALQVIDADFNIGLGYRAGYGITTGTYNTILGSGTTANGVTTGSYNTIIGSQITGLSASLSNTIILADGQGNQRLYINSSGNVGIGTTSPTAGYRLDIVGGDLRLRATGADATFLISNANGISSSIIKKGYDGVQAALWINNGDANGNIIFKSAGTNIMTMFGASENVLIGSGTTDAGYKLDVNGTARVSVDNLPIVISKQSGSAIGLYMNEASPSSNNYSLAKGSDNVLYINSGSGNVKIARNNNIVATFDTDQSSTWYMDIKWLRLEAYANDAYLRNGSGGIIFGTVAGFVMTINNTGALGLGTLTPNTSALFDMTSTTKGFLPPRMTNAQMVAIATPSAGLVVYDTTNNKLNVYDGTAWVAVH